MANHLQEGSYEKTSLLPLDRAGWNRIILLPRTADGKSTWHHAGRRRPGDRHAGGMQLTVIGIVFTSIANRIFVPWDVVLQMHADGWPCPAPAELGSLVAGVPAAQFSPCMSSTGSRDAVSDRACSLRLGCVRMASGRARGFPVRHCSDCQTGRRHNDDIVAGFARFRRWQ